MGANASSLTLPAVVGSALIDSLNPCSFALLLVFVATVVAMVTRKTTGDDTHEIRRWLLSRGGIYVLGIFLTYLALGFGLWGAAGLARTFSSTHIVSRIAALVALGLGLMAMQEALLPELGVRLTAHVDTPRVRGMVSGLSFTGLFGAGVLVGLCTVPCSGTVYIAVIALLSARSTVAQGIGYLVLYNVVFVLPLVALLALTASRPVYRQLARWQLHHRAYLKAASGAMALSVGLFTLFIV